MQNDESNVWVNVDGEQYTVPISDVIDHEEETPFEDSFYLESHLDAPAWYDLFEQYQESERKSEDER